MKNQRSSNDTEAIFDFLIRNRTFNPVIYPAIRCINGTICLFNNSKFAGQVYFAGKFMKYILFSPVVLLIIISAMRMAGKHQFNKIIDRLYRIEKIYEAQPYYFLEHEEKENQEYAGKLAKTITRQVNALKEMNSTLPDSTTIKQLLQNFTEKWTMEKISNSLFRRDGQFISDNNYLMSFFPYRYKKKSRTLFRIYRP